MKSLLVLTSRFPYPVVGGDRLRIYQICKELSKDYEITLLSICENRFEMNCIVEDDVFKKIERVYIPKWRSVFNVLFGLFSSRPLQVSYYQSREFVARAKDLFSENDVSLAHLIRTAYAIENLPGKKILEITDAISLNYSRIKVKEIFFSFRSFIYWFESKRLLMYERNVLKKFDQCFLISAYDRAFLLKENSDEWSRLAIVSNGVDVNNLPFQFKRHSSEIVFIGNFNSLQNFDAALYFLRYVFPLIILECPEATVKFIGRASSDVVKRLTSFAGVQVTGEIDSVALEARTGAVGICPIRIGAGVQNKVLEYMALGLPVVTTSVGLEGIDAIANRDVLIGDTPIDFATSVVRLLRDRYLAEQLAKFSREFVEEHHAWSSILLPYRRALNHLVDGE